MEIAVQLRTLFPKEFNVDRFIRLLVNQQIFDAFKGGSEARALKQIWEDDLTQFRQVRGKYLIY